MGLRGTVAAPGSKWWFSSGIPNSATGVDGDVDVNTLNGDMYEKQVGSWVLEGNLVGPSGPTGQAGVNAFGSPNTLSPAFATAYQATDPTKPAVLSAMIETIYTVSVASTLADTVELRIGSVQATVANGTGGTAVATFRTSLTGITLSIGMGTINRNQLTGFLPTGWFFALRRISGTTATIQGAFDQAVG